VSFEEGEGGKVSSSLLIQISSNASRWVWFRRIYVVFVDRMHLKIRKEDSRVGQRREGKREGEGNGELPPSFLYPLLRDSHPVFVLLRPGSFFTPFPLDLTEASDGSAGISLRGKVR